MIHEFEDNQVNITNTSNIKGKSGTWFWNESANKSDLNTEKDGYSNDSDENKNEEWRN